MGRASKGSITKGPGFSFNLAQHTVRNIAYQWEHGCIPRRRQTSTSKPSATATSLLGLCSDCPGVRAAARERKRRRSSERVRTLVATASSSQAMHNYARAAIVAAAAAAAAARSARNPKIAWKCACNGKSKARAEASERRAKHVLVTRPITTKIIIKVVPKQQAYSAMRGLQQSV